MNNFIFGLCDIFTSIIIVKRTLHSKLFHVRRHIDSFFNIKVLAKFNYLILEVLMDFSKLHAVVSSHVHLIVEGTVQDMSC